MEAKKDEGTKYIPYNIVYCNEDCPEATLRIVDTYRDVEADDDGKRPLDIYCPRDFDYAFTETDDPCTTSMDDFEEWIEKYRGLVPEKYILEGPFMHGPVVVNAKASHARRLLVHKLNWAIIVADDLGELLNSKPEWEDICKDYLAIILACFTNQPWPKVDFDRHSKKFPELVVRCKHVFPLIQEIIEISKTVLPPKVAEAFWEANGEMAAFPEEKALARRKAAGERVTYHDTIAVRIRTIICQGFISCGLEEEDLVVPRTDTFRKFCGVCVCLLNDLYSYPKERDENIGPNIVGNYVRDGVSVRKAYLKTLARYNDLIRSMHTIYLAMPLNMQTMYDKFLVSIPGAGLGWHTTNPLRYKWVPTPNLYFLPRVPKKKVEA